jgi:hypothetical protein
VCHHKTSADANETTKDSPTALALVDARERTPTFFVLRIIALPTIDRATTPTFFSQKGERIKRTTIALASTYDDRRSATSQLPTQPQNHNHEHLYIHRRSSIGREPPLFPSGSLSDDDQDKGYNKAPAKLSAEATTRRRFEELCHSGKSRRACTQQNAAVVLEEAMEVVRCIGILGVDGTNVFWSIPHGH